MWSILATHPMTMPHSSRITVIAKPLRSHSHSHGRNNPSSGSFFGEIFQQPLLRRVDTPPGSPEPELSVGGRFSGNRTLMRLHTQSHAPLLSLTRRHVRARGYFSGRHTSPPESPAVDLQAYAPGFLVQHLHHPLLSIFLFGGVKREK